MCAQPVKNTSPGDTVLLDTTSLDTTTEERSCHYLNILSAGHLAAIRLAIHSGIVDLAKKKAFTTLGMLLALRTPWETLFGLRIYKAISIH
ncbi:MAG: hypothetical protein WAK17_08100 [Candidatus Nitrosopolaris sp.]